MSTKLFGVAGFAFVLVGCGGLADVSDAGPRKADGGGHVADVEARDVAPAPDSSGVDSPPADSAVCHAGEPGLFTLVSGSAHSYWAKTIAVDRTSVYWIANDDGGGWTNVMKIPLCGGTPTTLASGQGFPNAIAVDATSVYWTAGPGPAPTTLGQVLKVPLSGGAPFTLASGFDGGGVSAIAVNATSLYWTASFGSFDGGWTETDAVMELPLAGGVAATLASSQQSNAIAVNDASVYWISYPPRVMTVPVGGGTPATLYAGPAEDRPIAIDSANVYWTDSTGTVMKVPMSGGVATSLASGGGALAVDGTSVYYAGDAALMKVSVAGGKPTKLAPASSPTAIAVDATSVYWVDAGRLMKLTPK